MFEHLNSDKPMPINRFKQFLLTKEKSFEQNVNLIRQAYDQLYQPVQRLELEFN